MITRVRPSHIPDGEKKTFEHLMYKIEYTCHHSSDKVNAK